MPSSKLLETYLDSLRRSRARRFGFVSLAHDEAAVDRTLEAADAALAEALQ